MLRYLGTQKQSRKSKKKKRDEYQELRNGLRRPWDKSGKIVPILIGALVIVPKCLMRNLEELGADAAQGC